MQTSQRLTVTVVNEVEVISAYDMATQLGIEYRALKSTIAKHLTQIEKEFGRVSFQMMPLQTKGGVQTVNVCWLTEEQAYFVTTLSKNTSIVMQ